MLGFHILSLGNTIIILLLIESWMQIIFTFNYFLDDYSKSFYNIRENFNFLKKDTFDAVIFSWFYPAVQTSGLESKVPQHNLRNSCKFQLKENSTTVLKDVIFQLWSPTFFKMLIYHSTGSFRMNEYHGANMYFRIYEWWTC